MVDQSAVLALATAAPPISFLSPRRRITKFSVRKAPATLVFVFAALIFGCGNPDSTSQPQVSKSIETQPSGGDNSQQTLPPLDLASQAIAANDLDAADREIRKALMSNSQDPAALELAGDVAVGRGQIEQALNLYWEAVNHSEKPPTKLLDRLAELSMQYGNPHGSIDALVLKAQLFPGDQQAKFDLVGLAAMIGRNDLLVEPLRWLSQRGQCDAESLQVLADPQRVQPDEDVCRWALEQSPDDLRAEYGLALLDVKNLDWKTAAKRLERVVDQHPEFIPAYVLYGRALIELGQYSKLPDWHSQAPNDVDKSAQYWVVAGLWAEHRGQYRSAARAFWQALRLDDTGTPESLAALASNLRQFGDIESADLVAEQSQNFSQMRDALKMHLERHGQSQESALKVADAMLGLGRIWEAELWARFAQSLPKDRVDNYKARYNAIRSEMTVKTPWRMPDSIVANKIDLADLPAVDWGTFEQHRADVKTLPAGEIRLSDQATERNYLVPRYSSDSEQGRWIYQSLGGGVAVIDFDLDGWPDLANAIPNGKPQQLTSAPNLLHRNLAGQFAEVSQASGYVDLSYTNGIAVGDFNSDGFPDLLDANFGQNRLFQNNGDGTWTDVSDAIQIPNNHWSTSAVITDIDGDGIADIFVAAYCESKGPMEIPCKNSEGRLETCSPLRFRAKNDSVYRGALDGTFIDASDQWMSQTTPGRGLGIIAGELDERPGIDLFIANDMTANHFWSGRTQPNGDGFRLSDVGVLRGVGNSGRSLSQASMGMAAGDPDGDGDIDFFLTHFSGDHNTYYEQVAPGLWSDRTFQVGLAQPSFQLLGFGTDWIDLDNNGQVELVIANGHVDNFNRTDIGYAMPPQVFRREAGGRWQLLDRAKLGDYFARDHVGRAMATLDVDRDGRTDFAVTHLDEPASLLINQSKDTGHSIRMSLVATRSHRDAIGTRVTGFVGNTTVHGQLTCGDGYLCSNQRIVAFGTGGEMVIKDVRVTWPSGKTEPFGTLKTGREYLLVEGSKDAHGFAGVIIAD